MEIDIEVLFGAVLIVIYATERFNTPGTIRASTTAGRYYAAAIVYLLIYLATFYVFTKYPKMLDYFDIDVSALSSSGIKPGDSSVILFALLLSLLVPKVPVISELDSRLRRFLHRLAAIPYEALRLSKEIQGSRYEIPLQGRDALARELQEQGLSAGEMNSTDPVIYGWVSIVSLMIQLKSWDRSHRFAAFVQERSGQLERIKEHYARITKMALSAVAMDEQASASAETSALQGAAKKFRVNLQIEQQALLSEMCDFISHGVLKTCFRYGSRQKTLRDMGFLDVEGDSGQGLSVNQTVMLFGLLLALVLANFILFKPPNENGERLLLTIAMIVSIYSAAVICAVLPKQRWRLFQYDHEYFYPTAGYLLSGIMAVGVSMVISLLFKTLIFAAAPGVDGFVPPFVMAWNQFASDSYPWLTMAFITAVSTAFMIDWQRPDWLSERLYRLADGAFQAALLMAAAALVHWWLSSLSVAGSFSGDVPDIGSVLRLSAIVGFTLGYLVPTWYRKSAAKRVGETAQGVAEVKSGPLPEPPVVRRLHG